MEHSHFCSSVRETHRSRVDTPSIPEERRSRKAAPRGSTGAAPRVSRHKSSRRAHPSAVPARARAPRLTRALKIENSKWPIFPLDGIKTKKAKPPFIMTCTAAVAARARALGAAICSRCVSPGRGKKGDACE